MSSFFGFVEKQLRIFHILAWGLIGNGYYFQDAVALQFLVLTRTLETSVERNC